MMGQVEETFGEYQNRGVKMGITIKFELFAPPEHKFRIMTIAVQ